MTDAAGTIEAMPRVQVIAPAHLGATAIAALRARGIEAREAAEPTPGEDVVAWALDATPTATAAVDLAEACAQAAAAGRPVCLLAPPPTAKGGARVATERAAALSYLRAHGAALVHDVDIWLEAVVALVRFGMPRGPHVAVIAPAGSWLEAQALSLVSEAEVAGIRPPLVSATGRGAKGDEPTDVVLFDPSLGPPPAHLPGLHVAVIARSELADGKEAALFGARAACGAMDVLGRAAERIAVGLGPAPSTESSSLDVDRPGLSRQLDKLTGKRVGDHETKVMLRAYGVVITRQVVATTPSAAAKKARSGSPPLGYPVEMKPWGPDIPTELEGCPVERGITSDALVRRAFSAVLAAAGKLQTAVQTDAVIIREPPPAGRDISVSFVKLPALGWTVVVDVPGAPQIAAAAAPLRLVDANTLAQAVVATRASDPEPDRIGLANILRRASHLVVDLDDKIARLELPRVVVGGRGSRSVVVDAWCQLVD